MQPTNNNGSIIIRFSKFGYKYSLTNLGKFDDVSAMGMAWKICQAISSDIDIGRFTPKNNDELFTAYHPLAKLSSHHEANSAATDCKVMVQLKLCSTSLRDRNLHQTMNFLKRYEKPIKNSDDALKFWQWLQGESKGNNRTINRHLASLKPVCPYFADIDKLKEPPIKHDKPFSKSEIKAIIDVFDRDYPHYSCFIKFLFATGARPNEATALTWDKVDFDAKTVTIDTAISTALDGSKVTKGTKTGVCRVIPISEKMVKALFDLRVSDLPKTPDHLTFVTHDGCTIDIRNFRARIWTKALNTANVPYRKIYNTRHTFCSHFLNETPDFIKLSSLTHGTKSGVQTLINHYAHIVEKVTLPDMW
jgi:integrase